MVRITAAAIGGILIGMIVMFAVGRFVPASNPSPDEIVRDIVDVPKMAQAVAERHRDEQYANLVSVEEVIALPTEFDRSEAMYALAGRSNSAGVQNLIFEANRVADDVERASLLNILFLRLASLDPQSALALARTDHFNATKSIQQTVWRAWARNDLDDALSAAKTQTSVAHRNSAAQSLFTAFGYMGNQTTERIEAELGIGPNRSSRARYLYQLADKSPAEAIAFINGVERGEEQQAYVSWLAHYVSMQDANSALGYANLFKIASDSERYSAIISSNVARENPQVTIERLLVNRQNTRSSSEFHSAVRALASTDLESAKQYFEQARSADDRRTIGSAIASELAKSDPVEALAWARTHDTEQVPYLQMSVLTQIAETDPQLALAEALNTPNAQMRSNMVSNVMHHLARNNPREAVVYLDQIQDRQQKIEMGQQLASSWIRYDPEAAIGWILSQDKEMAGDMIQRASYMLVRSNIDAAIQLLPRVDKASQESMRQQIAERLAIDRSADEAQSFIRQFQGQPGYDQLQASLITGVANTDVLMAKQLADQLADGSARDRAYVQVIAKYAETNPTEAARWLNSVSDDGMRGAAAGQLAAQWFAHDPAAAERWVNRLPAGSPRDDAIMHMASKWGVPSVEQEELIASIENRDKRGQAKIRLIYNLMRKDPAKARKLLEDDDISAYQRQQVEMAINQYGSRF